MTGLERAGLVVLDLDGTLVRLDVDWALLRSRLRTAATRHGFEPGANGVLSSLIAARDRATPAAGAEMEAIARDAEVGAAAKCPENARLVDLVNALSPRPPLAILSLNSRAAVEAALRRTALRASGVTVLGREDVTRPKPDPEGLLMLARAYSVAPGDIVLVGDSPSDHECARAAGARSIDVTAIGVSWRTPA